MALGAPPDKLNLIPLFLAENLTKIRHLYSQCLLNATTPKQSGWTNIKAKLIFCIAHFIQSALHAISKETLKFEIDKMFIKTDKNESHETQLEQ